MANSLADCRAALTKALEIDHALGEKLLAAEVTIQNLADGLATEAEKRLKAEATVNELLPIVETAMRLLRGFQTEHPIWKQYRLFREKRGKKV